MEIDSKDIQLLEILEKNSKASVQEIAEETGIPASTVHHRIKKLESNKIREVGISFAKGLALALNISCSGVNRFQTLLINKLPTLSIIKIKKDLYYTQFFNKENCQY